MDAEFRADPAFTMFPTILPDVADPVEHQHRGQGQLRIAGTEHLAARAAQQVLVLETGRSHWRTVRDIALGHGQLSMLTSVAPWRLGAPS
jgi:hypothetical protein